MNFDLEDHQVMLGDAIRSFLADQDVSSVNRAGLGSSTWIGLARTLGVLGATFPTSVGGVGGGPEEANIVMEALGEAASIEPFLETVILCGGILKRCESGAANALLSSIMLGEAVIALGALEPDANYALEDVQSIATRTSDGWLLSGRKSVVHSGPGATHYLITGRASGARRDTAGISLFAAPRDQVGLVRADYELADGRGATDLSFEAMFLPLSAAIANETVGFSILNMAVDEATAAACAEATGAMRALIAMTVEHLQNRRQFGQPLAAFQVLQHKVVDAQLALDRAVSAKHLAAAALSRPDVERQMGVSAAKATVADSLRLVGQTCIQLLGGLGFVDGLPHSALIKRLLVIDTLCGGKAYHLARWRRCDAALVAAAK